jgi:hypothetical protein
MKVGDSTHNELFNAFSLLSSNILRLLPLSIQVAGLQGVANPPCSKSIGAREREMLLIVVCLCLHRWPKSIVMSIHRWTFGQ